MEPEKIHILLVEDEEAHAEMVCRAFEDNAKQAILYVVPNLFEARARLAESTPHIVIADLILPDGMGTELLPGDKREPEYPLVIMTGKGDGQIAVEAIKGGAFDYVVKSEEILSSMPSIVRRVLREWDSVIKREQAEKALIQVKIKAEALEQSNRDLHDFVTIASHDLQEPLRKVIAFSDCIKERCSDVLDDISKDYLDRMQNSAQRMFKLINVLLELSQVSALKKPFQSVDLNQVVEEVLVDLADRIAQTDARVETGTLPTIEADPSQMHQLFQNLIGNAIKYHKPDEPPVIQLTGSSNSEDEWEIRVKDNGIGFKEEHADRIFKPFERLHGRSAYEGTGMGLAICKRIVGRHRGTISATSQPEMGTTFIIHLPGTQSRDS